MPPAIVSMDITFAWANLYQTQADLAAVRSMDGVFKWIEGHEGEIVDVLSRLCQVPAIGPESGGDGEGKKAHLLREILINYGFKDIKEYPCKDSRIPDGARPNVVATLNGSDPSLGSIWIVSHIDVVPPGEARLWKTDPYKPEVREGKLYGRGVEDNGQAVVASMFAAASLIATKKEHGRNVKLAFVSEEETGSKYGIQHLIAEGLFKPDDLIIVPDAGSPDGSQIEVVEKSHLQLKVKVTGKQCHASRPHKGINAYRVAASFVTELTNSLYEKYSERDELFIPPVSTFEPTKKEANVPNVNTIPGEDVSYMDFRILPTIPPEDVLETVKRFADLHSHKSNARIEIAEFNTSRAPPATPVESPVVKALMRSIREVSGVTPVPIGIGGGTCAAFFRKAGLPAIVWSTSDETAHEPNEHVSIKNLVNDAKVYAHLFISA
jgi:succinyl-diaminopimelate desuccinylase